MVDISVPVDMTPQEFEELAGNPFIVIPPGIDGVEREGDNIMLAVEAGMAEWKNAGVSYHIPLIVIEPGINNGKEITDWYPAANKTAMGINKQAATMFGVIDKVFKEKNGKMIFDPSGFAGARARAKVVREKSNKGNLRSVLESTQFAPLDSGASTSPSTPL